ncbi:MAG: hypothetical protein E6Y23_05275 [Negativicoccus massiliensis]|nr:hypothetical protein [Negativicoccus massiliensis]
MKINDNWWGKRVQIKAINGKMFIGVVDDITGKEDNDETGKDSLTLYDGKDYIFFSDDEIVSIEVLER